MVQRRETAAVRQTQIIDAARRVIVKYGSEHVTIKRIAREVGISEANIYRHFKSKKQILSLLVAEIEEALLGDLEKETSTDGRGTLATLEILLKNQISSIEQKRGITFQIIAEIVSLGDKRLNKKVSDTINKYIERLKELLARGITAGDVRPDVDLEAAATLFFSMVQGLVNIWALSNYSFNLEAKFVPVWQVFRKTIAKSSPRT